MRCQLPAGGSSDHSHICVLPGIEFANNCPVFPGSAGAATGVDLLIDSSLRRESIMHDMSAHTHSVEKGGADAAISASATTDASQMSEEDRRRAEAAKERRRKESSNGEPDVLLDVPNLSIDEVSLEVNNLRVHLALDARLANLVRLAAGAEASSDQVSMTLKGVHAEALMKVRLDNVADILQRALETVDHNPQIVERVLKGLEHASGAVGPAAGAALGERITSRRAGVRGRRARAGGLLTRTVDRMGHTIQHVVDRSGRLIENVLDRSGTVVRRRLLGTIYNLPVIGEYTDEAGRAVRRLRDTSGAILELTEDPDAGVGRIRVVSPPPEAKRDGRG
jgi:hypothetical protein